MSAQQYKDAGDEAWKSNNINVAIEQWTLAIENSDKSDKEFLKKLYSNRSAAYAKSKNYASSLADAQKCCDIDQTWSKGYLRKGDALFFMGKYTESYNAYNNGLRYNANDSELMARSEKAMSAIGRQSESGNYSRSNTSSSSSSSASSYSIPQTTLGKVEYYARLGIFLNAVLYLLPLGRSLNSNGFRLFVICSVVAGALSIFHQHGKIEFNMNYASKVFSDPAAGRVFLAVLLFFNRPYFMAMLPIILPQIAVFTPQLLKYGTENLPALKDKLAPVLAQYAPQLLQSAGNIDNLLNQLLSKNTLNILNTQLYRSAALCEVMHGIFLIIELILPTRNLLFLVMWWQYLQMRYMVDNTGDLKFAFKTVDGKILELLSYKMVPPVAMTYYRKLQDFLASQVKVPTPGQQPSGGMGSMFSKCSVM